MVPVYQVENRQSPLGVFSSHRLKKDFAPLDMGRLRSWMMLCHTDTFVQQLRKNFGPKLLVSGLGTMDFQGNSPKSTRKWRNISQRIFWWTKHPSTFVDLTPDLPIPWAGVAEWKRRSAKKTQRVLTSKLGRVSTAGDMSGNVNLIQIGWFYSCVYLIRLSRDHQQKSVIRGCHGTNDARNDIVHPTAACLFMTFFESKSYRWLMMVIVHCPDMSWFMIGCKFREYINRWLTLRLTSGKVLAGVGLVAKPVGLGINALIARTGFQPRTIDLGINYIHRLGHWFWFLYR